MRSTAVLKGVGDNNRKGMLFKSEHKNIKMYPESYQKWLKLTLNPSELVLSGINRVTVYAANGLPL